jgi:Tfp pilus assembly protein PilF
MLLASLCACSPAEEAPVETPDPQVTTIPPVVNRPAPGKPRPLPSALKAVYQDLSRGQFERGRSAAQKFLASNPGDAQANLMIGLSFFKADNHGASVPFFERAIAADPEYYITHDYMAEASFLLGDLDGARKHYQQFRSFVPGEPRTYVRIGAIELEESRTELAAAYFREALTLFEAMRTADPRSFARQQAELASAHARLGDVHFAGGDYTSARDELEQATTIWPQNISAFYTLSQVYRRLGHEDLADGALRRYEDARRLLMERSKDE